MRNNVWKIFVTLTAVAYLATAANGQAPVLHWAFDADSPTVDDISLVEPAADGVLQGTATYTTDTPGSASPFALDLTAEGTESWVNGGDAAKVDTLESFTLTTWVKLAGWNTGGSNNQRLYAKQGGGPNFDGISWNIIAPVVDEPAPDNFRLALFVGAAGIDGDQPTFVAGITEDQFEYDLSSQWYFLAATYDGTNEDGENGIFYIGDETGSVVELTDPFDMVGGAVASTAGSATANIGLTDAAPGVDFSINGFQDDFRIYDQVLSQEQLESVLMANLTSALAGDFDGNGVLDAADINDLTTAVLGDDPEIKFDVNGNGAVDDADRVLWVKELRKTWLGDANLDGEFNSSDLVESFTFGLYESGEAALWQSGDFNGDGKFDSADFVTAFADGGYEVGPVASVAAVPEPSAMALALLGLGVFALRRR